MDVADIFSELDDHGFEDTLDDRKLAVLNDVYHDVCTRQPWPFLEVLDTSPTLTGNVITAQHPIRAVLFLRTSSQELLPYRLDDFLKSYGSVIDQTGNPGLYYFVGDEIRLWPAPSSTPAGLLLSYLRREDDLTVDSVEADILLPKEFHRSVLVNGALYKLYALEDDAELATGFQAYYEQSIQRLSETLWKKQYQRAPIVLEDAGPYETPFWLW